MRGLHGSAGLMIPPAQIPVTPQQGPVRGEFGALAAGLNAFLPFYNAQRTNDWRAEALATLEQEKKKQALRDAFAEFEGRVKLANTLTDMPRETALSLAESYKNTFGLALPGFSAKPSAPVQGPPPPGSPLAQFPNDPTLGTLTKRREGYFEGSKTYDTLTDEINKRADILGERKKAEAKDIRDFDERTKEKPLEIQKTFAAWKEAADPQEKELLRQRLNKLATHPDEMEKLKNETVKGFIEDGLNPVAANIQATGIMGELTYFFQNASEIEALAKRKRFALEDVWHMAEVNSLSLAEVVEKLKRLPDHAGATPAPSGRVKTYNPATGRIE